MFKVIPTCSSQITTSRLFLVNLPSQFGQTFGKNHNPGVQCKAVPSAAAAAATTGSSTKPEIKKKKSQYQIENLTNWLLKQEQEGNLDAELAVVLSSISWACKQIASLLQRSSITDLTGLQGTVNIQGEDQKKLDVISNELFCNCLRSSGRTEIIASEEEDIPDAVEETYSGNYIVVFDPLDGSANIDISMTTGSIFGIYDRQCLFDLDDDSTLDEAKQKCIVNVCQPGSNLLAAGYVNIGLYIGLVTM